MVGLDSGDLLVMGGHNLSIFEFSNAIYRLSSNVWNYVGELHKPMYKLAAPIKIGKIVFLAGGSTAPDNPFLQITLDENEAIQSQEEIGNFDTIRMSLFAATDGYCTT